MERNLATTWESALRGAGYDAFDTGRDMVMLGQKGQRRVEARFDPKAIGDSGSLKAIVPVGIGAGIYESQVRDTSGSNGRP